ncbi:MAG: YbbR-like domain-containing protein [Bacteroidia bacterium]|nr:YbbR-like domain-containing protein [Bacteroidia bacterium]
MKITWHYLKRERVKIRQSLLVFLVFLLISTSIWLINALRKNYSLTIAFPVRYINFPKDKLSVGEMPSYLFILIRTNGYTLLQYKIKPPATPITIDVNSYVLVRASEKSPRYYLLTRYLLDNIEGQVPSDVKVLDISPDSLYFQFDKVFKKKVPVIPAIKIEFRRQYSFRDIPTVKPDSIWVYGPKAVIDTLQSIKTEPVMYRNLSRPIEKKYELQKIYNLTTSVKYVTVNIPVEKYTEASLNIPVEIKNLPDSLILKVIPDNISVSCLVGLSNYDKIKPYYFKATVDYKATKEKFSKKLKVSVGEFPRMISNLRFHPQKVNYIIKKKY